LTGAVVCRGLYLCRPGQSRQLIQEISSGWQGTKSFWQTRSLISRGGSMFGRNDWYSFESSYGLRKGGLIFCTA
jgi:hypothetical protein